MILMNLRNNVKKPSLNKYCVKDSSIVKYGQPYLILLQLNHNTNWFFAKFTQQNPRLELV